MAGQPLPSAKIKSNLGSNCWFNEIDPAYGAVCWFRSLTRPRSLSFPGSPAPSRLFNWITAIGSMNRVDPVEDWSCTIPGTWFLYSDLTGRQVPSVAHGDDCVPAGRYSWSLRWHFNWEMYLVIDGLHGTAHLVKSRTCLRRWSPSPERIQRLISKLFNGVKRFQETEHFFQGILIFVIVLVTGHAPGSGSGWSAWSWWPVIQRGI